MSPRELAWPCPNVVPGMAPVAAILARTEETVVAVTGIRAYPTGFGFTLNLRLRNLHPGERRGFWPFPEFGHHRGRLLPDAGILRLTIEFADGRSVSNLDAPSEGSDAPDPERPMLSSGPGTGMEATGPFRDRWIWDMDYRVRPLPSPGPPAFICVWPGRGIPTSSGTRLIGRRCSSWPSGWRWNGRMPDGEHFPGQPFGFWTSPSQDLVHPAACACDEGWVLSGIQTVGRRW